MKARMPGLKSIAVIAVLGIVLAGCAAMEKSEATDTEQLLASAGFKMKPADTPEKLRPFKNPDPAESRSP